VDYDAAIKTSRTIVPIQTHRTCLRRFSNVALRSSYLLRICHESEICSLSLLLFNYQVLNRDFIFLSVFHSVSVFVSVLWYFACLVFNMIGCVDNRIKCEFRSFSLEFHVFPFHLFRHGFFMTFSFHSPVQTYDCLRDFVTAGADNFECQVHRDVLNCCGSRDCRLSSFVLNSRRILLRGGGSRHDAQGGCEQSRAEISLTDIIFASDYHLKEIHGFTECISLHRIEIPS
jgi:hypothetical protein